MHELIRGGRPVAVSRALPVPPTAVVVDDVDMGALVHATMAVLDAVSTEVSMGAEGVEGAGVAVALPSMSQGGARGCFKEEQADKEADFDLHSPEDDAADIAVQHDGGDQSELVADAAVQDACLQAFAHTLSSLMQPESTAKLELEGDVVGGAAGAGAGATAVGTCADWLRFRRGKMPSAAPAPAPAPALVTAPTTAPVRATASRSSGDADPAGGAGRGKKRVASASSSSGSCGGGRAATDGTGDVGAAPLSRAASASVAGGTRRAGVAPPADHAGGAGRGKKRGASASSSIVSCGVGGVATDGTGKGRGRGRGRGR